MTSPSASQGHASGPATITLVGAGGFGAVHLANILRLQQAGRATLKAIVDPTIAPDDSPSSSSSSPSSSHSPTGRTYSGAPLFNTIAESLTYCVPDIFVIATPIHFHAVMTAEALASGAHVLLEKPPFATLAHFEELLAVEAQSKGSVQVGFQSLGSEAVQTLQRGGYDLGRIKAVRVSACWLRTAGYFSKAVWVGKKSMGESEINAGVVTNSLAHAVVTALHLVGVKLADDVEKVEVERYRANIIDVDDTTSVRITPRGGGPPITLALTLCATTQTHPKVQVVGEKDTATLSYVTDDITLASTGETVHYSRTNLLENLIAHVQTGVPLICPLRTTGSLMRVAEAIRLRPDPTHIARKYITSAGDGLDAHRMVRDVEAWIDRAVSADALFSEVGAPWAFTGRDSSLFTAKVGDQAVFDILDGAGTVPSSSPRPYVHPLKTLRGVQVSATRPADHDWHNGLGFAVPDVDGTSYWGGGTYVHGQGYVNLENHGRIVSERLDTSRPNTTSHALVWRNKDDTPVLREVQQMSWSALPTDLPVQGWRLSFRTTLSPLSGPVSFGSPGTNGRTNAGYGGFFWRLPHCSKVSITAPSAEGEDAVHGSAQDWVAWSGRFESQPGSNGNATLVLVPADEASRRDKWVVRCTSYPGIGSALAWEERVPLGMGESLSRAWEIAVLDGILSASQVAEVVDVLRRHVA